MKQQHFLVAFFVVLFSFLLFVYLSEGKSEVAEDYWKKMMKSEPLPEPIKDILNNPFRTGQERFAKNFNTKSVVIIYHNPNV
ncbi:hypothetical protein F2Q70_00038171 [Brassica cretica]|uniref:Uncharacterized protein n=5 Tax=Brassica TaxID=3705 RepID=A0A8S9MIF6_BRACR|nr:PREDICTED: uncharacterized protein LOC106311047 [Brassica oleracea var. oleracea]XP_013715952.1 uncharacterized protein BNAC08G02990D [Brassica napus]KAF2587923.1 hypothetical protein F2Q70_00038171 [Brassica cretica]VDD54002.1 unnamed protein product [Brassica oleracea]KAF2617259.1 hypothetical protein F2Q68_00038638 [Brassica cretica]KAF3497703.1 hypothetical protein DY000_02052203 [Brassica cretica]KAF3572550.1 hypothetical protein F2Q69_00058456 [Brassica cretica]